jgi:D-arabinono-1,4-lactone oxidase
MFGCGLWRSPSSILAPTGTRSICIASVTVSVSGGPGIDYWSYLVDVDAILRQYGARPHWGKLHFNRVEDMPSLYPRFHDFQAIRRSMDPSGRFLNDHLRNLFE